MKVLVTGASGRVGSAVRPYLRREFQLRLCDVVPPALPPSESEELHLCDIADPTAVAAAVDGVDAVLHLACVHGLELTFEQSLDVNYRGTLNLLEAASSRSLPRFLYASSHHVLGAYPRAAFDPATERPAPDAFYGLSKAFGEAACAMYALRTGLPTFVVRIGNADPDVGDERALRMWTSARDLATLFTLGLRLPDLTHEVVYGTSSCPDALFDNSRACELGYRPLDNAEDHLAAGFLPRSQMGPERGPDHVGGAYAAAPLPPMAVAGSL